MNYLMHTTRILAYIDPGTLSMVFQVVIGVVFALLVSVKFFWNSITCFFKSLFSIKEKSGEAES